MSYAIDVLGIAGFAALCWGLWQVWPPLAWIIGGAIVMYFAVRLDTNVDRVQQQIKDKAA